MQVLEHTVCKTYTEILSTPLIKINRSHLEQWLPGIFKHNYKPSFKILTASHLM